MGERVWQGGVVEARRGGWGRRMLNPLINYRRGGKDGYMGYGWRGRGRELVLGDAGSNYRGTSGRERKGEVRGYSSNTFIF